MIQPWSRWLSRDRRPPVPTFDRSIRRTFDSHRVGPDLEPRRSRSSWSRGMWAFTVASISEKGTQVRFGTYFFIAFHIVALSVIDASLSTRFLPLNRSSHYRPVYEAALCAPAGNGCCPALLSKGHLDQNRRLPPPLRPPWPRPRSWRGRASVISID